MSLLGRLFGVFRKKESLGERARKKILLSIKDIKRLFNYPHLNTKEQYTYDTLRYLHRLVTDPLNDLMVPEKREVYYDFCERAMEYSDRVISSLVGNDVIEDIEEKFIEVTNSKFVLFSMPFEAYQKLKK